MKNQPHDSDGVAVTGLLEKVKAPFQSHRKEIMGLFDSTSQFFAQDHICES
jgi:hypothetical protein